MRLDKFVSEAMGVSRRQARKLIMSGRVKVGGLAVKDRAAKIGENDEITRRGQRLTREEFVYIMLNKPRGVLSASKDGRDITAVDLVKDDFPRRNIFPAGRLDKASTGFLLLTDDGKFAHDILGPKNHVPKKYIVTVDAPVTDEVVRRFKDGVTLADGSVMKSADILPLADGLTCEITLYQGVYHQIKRMLGVCGIGVITLHRVQIGGLRLDKDLAPGEYRKLTETDLSEISNLS